MVAVVATVAIKRFMRRAMHRIDDARSAAHILADRRAPTRIVTLHRHR